MVALGRSIFQWPSKWHYFVGFALGQRDNDPHQPRPRRTGAIPCGPGAHKKRKGAREPRLLAQFGQMPSFGLDEHPPVSNFPDSTRLRSVIDRILFYSVESFPLHSHMIEKPARGVQDWFFAIPRLDQAVPLQFSNGGSIYVARHPIPSVRQGPSSPPNTLCPQPNSPDAVMCTSSSLSLSSHPINSSLLLIPLPPILSTRSLQIMTLSLLVGTCSQTEGHIFRQAHDEPGPK